MGFVGLFHAGLKRLSLSRRLREILAPSKVAAELPIRATGGRAALALVRLYVVGHIQALSRSRPLIVTHMCWGLRRGLFEFSNERRKRHSVTVRAAVQWQWLSTTNQVAIPTCCIVVLLDCWIVVVSRR